MLRCLGPVRNPGRRDRGAARLPVDGFSRFPRVEALGIRCPYQRVDLFRLLRRRTQQAQELAREVSRLVLGEAVKSRWFWANNASDWVRAAKMRRVLSSPHPASAPWMRSATSV